MGTPMIGHPLDVMAWLDGQDPDCLFEVKPHKKRRSLTQNAYYWVLLNQLARVLGVPDTELHGHMLREYGSCDAFTVRADVPLADYFRYYDVVGAGELDGVRYRHVKAYKGSSEMDSGEFKRLLDGVIEECQIQGIPTMTPEEVARMRWVEGVVA